MPSLSSRTSGRRAVALAALLAFLASPALAQTAAGYPTKPVRMLVPYSAGSAIDVVARIVAQKVGDGWGQQIVIDNRTGANAIIGTEAAAKSAPDGYTLLMANDAALAVNPSLYAKLPYDTLRDFAPITLAGANQLLLVMHPSTTPKTVQELLALARERKGELNYATSGSGSAQHLPMEMLMTMTGVKLTHVPYKALGPALNDVIGGQVPVMFAGMPGALPHVRTGKLRALAIAAGRRSGAAPDIPTVAEQGVPGFDYAAWVGYLAPAGTPAPIVQKLNADFIRAMNDPEVRSRLGAVGFEIQTSTPEEFRAFLGREIDKMARLVREAGIKAPQ